MEAEIDRILADLGAPPLLDPTGLAEKSQSRTQERSELADATELDTLNRVKGRHGIVW